jgi:signal transduction histidine kinase
MNRAERKKRGRPQGESVQSSRSAERKALTMEAGSIADLPQMMDIAESKPKRDSWPRLDHLYRISKLFATYETAEKPLEAVLAIISSTLPIRSAILIDEVEGRANVHMWIGEDTGWQDLMPARTHAVRLFTYLAGSGSTFEGSADVAPEESGSDVESRKRTENFIVVPLAVGHRPVFGVLQLECTQRFTEEDVAFVNAVGNQLAIALDRYNTGQREVMARVKAEEAERRMQFLADASRLLAASLDYRSTWESVAHLAVRHIADICYIDIIEEDQPRQRIAVSSPKLPEELTTKGTARFLDNVILRALRTTRPAIYPEVVVQSGAAIPEPIEQGVAEEAHSLIKSYISVPLRFRERIFGALTIFSAHPDRRYTFTDLILLQDLAGRVAAAFENAQLYGDALQAIRSRDEVLGVVSHDLKGPLNIVLGYLSLFLDKSAPDEPLICNRRQVEAVRKSATQMNILIGDLLDTASIEARHLRVERSACSVAALVGEAMELAQPLAQSRKDIEIKSDVPTDLTPVFVDRHRILQVFANLVDNAVKFTLAGGTITVRARQLENEVQCSVEDTGPGIPEHEVLHVFDRFWQAKKTARQGTGLGLFIVKGIVESHGGKVWVESTLGRGTEFFFTLPVPPPS